MPFCEVSIKVPYGLCRLEMFSRVVGPGSFTFNHSGETLTSKSLWGFGVHVLSKPLEDFYVDFGSRVYGLRFMVLS